MCSLKTPEVIAVVGPTATGKTRVGAAVARRLGTEVISVDSQLVYEGLSVGVARPTPDEMQGVPHHMIGVVPPTTVFSAGNYADMARPILDNLIRAGKSPILVGGTGFYLRALLQPQHLPQVPVDDALRLELKQRTVQEGPEVLYAELRQQDPKRAAQLHPNDTKRIIRALEIIRQTGRPVSPTPQEFAYPTRVYGLAYAHRETHLEVIRDRLDQMMANGFLEEVRQLYAAYGFCYALQTAHGYPELVDVVQGKRSVESAVEQITINIRQYSKRQMTWFRQLPGITWYFADQQSPDEIITDIVDKNV